MLLLEMYLNGMYSHKYHEISMNKLMVQRFN